MTIMNKKNLILLVVLSNFAFAFGQDINYFHNLTEQLQYSDCIAYKFMIIIQIQLTIVKVLCFGFLKTKIILISLQFWEKDLLK